MDIKTFFQKVGEFAPIFLVFLSGYLLWKKENLLFYYIIGIVLSSILNFIIKIIIKQPRPSADLKLFNIAMKNGKYLIFKDGMPYDLFGMPSAHSQMIWFSTIFIYLSLKNTKISLIYILFCIITMLQRYYFNHHTISQVIVGSFVGSIFAYFIFYMAEKQIIGKVKEKKDDDFMLYN